ncbi:taste receptor type 1 member 1-like [Amia ocellicauda]|uniref:taste receptor type 1 member 1-like n=1 Tax=Amia ocellicauda TaxID=2972642 RepID=UPI003464D75C
MYAAGCQILQLLDLTLAEINNSTQLLPNISLGYQVLDCSLDTDCLDSTLLFLSNKKTMYVDSQPLMYKKQTDIKAIFGPSYSATALGIGGIISASATNQKLSNKELYPSFMRTTPNDKNLVLAILQFLKGIGWKWVSLLVSADDYGSDVGKSFTELAPEYGLLVEMRKVQFSLFNQSVYYDENGDPPFGYDILLLRNQGSEFVFKSIGVYSQKTRQESIDENWVLFLRNKTDEYNCHLCPKAHWSPQGSERCFPRTLRYLSWDSGIGVGLLVSTSAVLLVVVATGAVFALKRHTPVVRSSGGKMAFIMLASLLSSCICLYGNFGMPSTLSCHFRTLSELCFTVCLACIAVRSCQLLCIFKLAAKLPKACDFWIKDRGQYVLIFLCTVPQVVISIYLITGDVPVPEYFEKDMVLLTCKTYNPFLNLSYNAALILLCFVFSYAGKNLPDNYNEAKCIAFSLFICIVSRVSYMTVITVYKGDTVDFHIACSLVNVSAAYGSYFLPKCYAILLRPELNTTAHFQSCIQLYTMQKSTH